jgi:epoxyqueuosine reductase
MNSEELHTLISRWSEELGFLAYGSTSYRTMEMERFDEYLSKGYNAGMDYLVRNREIRRDPALLLPGLASVLCFLAPYKQALSRKDGAPLIASYALGKDYHSVIKEKLRVILKLICEAVPGAEGRVFTDSAPILEREWAASAGLGFIGKNNFLISKKHGLHTLIGIILLNVQVHYTTAKVKEGCGSCERCLKSCPTEALCAPRMLNSSKCISYQTIESKKRYFQEEEKIGRSGWIFGCDICLEACPWAEKGGHGEWVEFMPVEHPLLPGGIMQAGSEEWLGMEKETFLEVFKDSPLRRAGFEKIKDNLEANIVR